MYSFGVVLWELVTKEQALRGQLRDVVVPVECPQVELICSAREMGRPICEPGSIRRTADGRPALRLLMVALRAPIFAMCSCAPRV